MVMHWGWGRDGACTHRSKYDVLNGRHNASALVSELVQTCPDNVRKNQCITRTFAGFVIGTSVAMVHGECRIARTSRRVLKPSNNAGAAMKTLSPSALSPLDALLVVSHRELAPQLKRYSPLPRDPMVLSVFTPIAASRSHGHRTWDRFIAHLASSRR